ncbi:hypothetical protein Moror_13339 [Moniliophthora roreri MCA 2997]|uniref:Uncharacterized protein n=1 Tax=Moniliophthora roreri (strain MCA 2997) TaxID=1381753 RepID=V2WVM1_MONRO|nr:hypothetical protein Moror_13339 [Moniliophthora roreri MCA 2997]
MDTPEFPYPAQHVFTFPSSHNFNDSPYPTPSKSPTKPVLRSPTSESSLLSAYTTPSPLTRTPPPDAPPGSVDIEHQPRKDDGYNCPPSAWQLFRQKFFKERQQAQEEAAADQTTKKLNVARLADAIDWIWKMFQQRKVLSTEQKIYWKDPVKEHERLYSGYAPRDSLRNDMHELWMALAEVQNRLVNDSSQFKSVSFDVPSSSRLRQSSSLSLATSHQGGSDGNGASFTTRNDGNFNLTFNNAVFLSCEPDQLQTVEQVFNGVLQLQHRTMSTTPTVTRGAEPNMHGD